jgi:hypothetical protein
MRGEATEQKIQCPSGIIDSQGEWIRKCQDVGMDSVTAEIKLA